MLKQAVLFLYGYTNSDITDLSRFQYYKILTKIQVSCAGVEICLSIQKLLGTIAYSSFFKEILITGAIACIYTVHQQGFRQDFMKVIFFT